MKYVLAAALAAMAAGCMKLDIQTSPIEVRTAAPTAKTGIALDIQTRVVEYHHNGVDFKGIMAWNKAQSGRRPGVLVVHEWWGLNDYARQRARQLAELGYVAFAVDMYGGGAVAADRTQAGALASAVRGDHAMMRSRVNAGLDVLRAEPSVDRRRIAAIGYCFGGTTVLELARSGADIAGVVSFHGNLDTPDPADAKNIRCKVLVLHGADDPGVGPDQVLAFQDEMRQAGVDWQLIAYGGAVHTFTNPAAGNDPSRGSAYNAAADRRSWQAMKAFFGELFDR